MRRRSASTERLMALCLLAIFCCLLWYVVAAPVLASFARLNDEIQQTEFLAERYAQVLETLPAIEALEAASTAPELGTSYVSAESPDLGSAQLQQWLGEMLAANGVRADSLLVLAQDNDGWIGVRTQFRTDLPNLGALLAVLDGMEPITVVRRISIDGDQSGGAQDPQTWDELAVSIDVFAPYRLVEADEPL